MFLCVNVYPNGIRNQTARLLRRDLRVSAQSRICGPRVPRSFICRLAFATGANKVVEILRREPAAYSVGVMQRQKQPQLLPGAAIHDTIILEQAVDVGCFDCRSRSSHKHLPLGSRLRLRSAGGVYFSRQVLVVRELTLCLTGPLLLRVWSVARFRRSFRCPTVGGLCRLLSAYGCVTFGGTRGTSAAAVAVST